MIHSALRLAAFMVFASAAFWGAACASPSAEQVYSRHIAAVGGQKKLDAITSLIFRGTYSEGDYSGPAAQAKMRPYYRVVGDPAKPMTDGGEGYDGQAWEYYADPGIVLRVVSSAAAALRHNSHIHGLFIDYKVQGSTLTLVGETSIAGRRAYQMRIKMLDGFEEDEFIDAETFLRVASRKVAKIHAFGDDVATESRYSDFRPVAGVLMPFLDSEVEIATGRVLSTFKTNEIVANEKLDVAVFSPPEFERTPAGALIESLFAQRDDAQSVLWTHFDFRRAHPDLSTDEASQIAGYQILKMNGVPAAVALLEANARQYPKSSGAAFGLGRAYRTAGEPAKARAEFERALKLDPNNKRAKAALEALDAPTPKVQ